MIKLFYSGTYKVRHELINKNNICELLKDDMRSKIVGDVKDTIYASDGVVLKNNKNVKYIGGFYYEKENPNKSTCENVVCEELRQIDECDIIVANLMNYSAIASITEILYGAMKGKRVVIFCNPKITNYEVTGEYWFQILAAKEMDKNIEVKFTECEDDIVDYINSLGD